MKKLWKGVRYVASMDWLVDVTNNVDSSLVEKGERRGKKRILLLVLARCVAAWCIVVFGLPNDTPMWALVGVLIPTMAWASNPMKRAFAYRSAWLAGRRQMVADIQDHDTAEAWLQCQMDFDMVHVLGLSPVVPDSPEGLS